MTDASGVVKKNVRPIDRITLKPEVLCKVNEWLLQLEPRLKGMKVSRSDLVNHLLIEKSEALSRQEMIGIEEKFFDPVKALQWAAKEARAATLKGNEINLGRLVNGLIGKREKRPKPLKAKVSKELVLPQYEKNPSSELDGKNVIKERP